MPKIDLYPHQEECLNRIKNGSILCGDTGSGKSRTALAYYYVNNGGKVNCGKYVEMKKDLKDIYIITTARKRDTLEWEQELNLFLLSTHEDLNYYDNKVVVDSWNNIKKYEKVKNSFFIFDEQRVVGSGAWVKAFLKISRGNWWILLSATPGDTWMDYVPVFIANGFYNNRTDFINQHVVYKRFVKFPCVDRYVGIKKLCRFRDQILIDMDYKMPCEYEDIDIFCDYDKFSYNDLYKNRWNKWENKPIRNAAELCYLLRKEVNSSPDRQLKLLELVEKHPRSIIFYNFDYELEILKDILSPITNVSEWNGHVHKEIPKTKNWVYLVQYTAGAEGWNCVKTDTTIFFSQNYSYKTLHQAKGRINRLNTPFKKLYYYHLKSRSGIDLAISRAIKAKKKFNEREYVGGN